MIVLIGRGRDGHHGQWPNPILLSLVELLSRSGLFCHVLELWLWSTAIRTSVTRRVIDVPCQDLNMCNQGRVWCVHFLLLRTLSHLYDYSLCSYLLPMFVLIFLCRSLQSPQTCAISWCPKVARYTYESLRMWVIKVIHYPFNAIPALLAIQYLGQ